MFCGCEILKSYILIIYFGFVLVRVISFYNYCKYYFLVVLMNLIKRYGNFFVFCRYLVVRKLN